MPDDLRSAYRSTPTPVRANRWSIVLSGGEGERMQPFIRRWLGHDRPKQYCSFTGQRTMLEHTLVRAVAAAGCDRVVTVASVDHREFIANPRRLDLPGRLIFQPRRCGTGPGLFLPLTVVMAQDPDAVVAIMPSDHYIHSNGRFEAIISEAFRLAEFLPGQIVLLAATPDGPETDYGWIVPGKRINEGGTFLTSGFKENPRAEDSEEYFRRGWYWNTMIIVARAATLWNHAQDLHPAMMTRFQALRGWIGLPEEEGAVGLAYQTMPSVNLSRDYLEPLADWTVGLPMTGIHWSDWGRPERMEQTLIKIGKQNAFPETVRSGVVLAPGPA